MSGLKSSDSDEIGEEGSISDESRFISYFRIDRLYRQPHWYPPSEYAHLYTERSPVFFRVVNYREIRSAVEETSEKSEKREGRATKTCQMNQITTKYP